MVAGWQPPPGYDPNTMVHKMGSPSSRNTTSPLGQAGGGTQGNTGNTGWNNGVFTAPARDPYGLNAGYIGAPTGDKDSMGRPIFTSQRPKTSSLLETYFGNYANPQQSTSNYNNQFNNNQYLTSLFGQIQSPTDIMATDTSTQMGAIADSARQARFGQVPYGKLFTQEGRQAQIRGQGGQQQAGATPTQPSQPMNPNYGLSPEDIAFNERNRQGPNLARKYFNSKTGKVETAW